MKIKGFDKNLCCRGTQFKVGCTYDTGAKDSELKLCTNTVFHYCDSLQKVHEYYSVAPCEANRFCEIEVLGAEVTDDTKSGSNRIKILREIVGDELDRLRGTINGNTGLFNSGDWNSGDWNSGDWNSGDCNSGYRNSGGCNSGYRNSGDWNSGDCNSGDWNSGDWNSGDCNSGYRNSGDCNSGYWNSCNFSSGVFCSKEEKIRIFNAPSSMTMSEFMKSEYYSALMSEPFFLTEWVEYTEEEKNTDAKKATSGYLRTIPYKEACAKWWEKLTKANKSIIKSMPNFNAKVFKEITGIEVQNDG